MSTFINNFILVVLSCILTFLFSWFLFKKSQKKKSLTPYLKNSLKIFSDINKELKKNLKIKYKNNLIDNFYKIQYIIANTGNSTIKDCKKPLTLAIPKKTTLLDVKILYISPIGREIDFKIIKRNKQSFIKFIFSILNKKEYFICEIYIGGEVNLDDFEFTIETEDLPPKIEVFETQDYTPKRRSSDLMILISLALITIISAFLTSTDLLKIFALLPKEIQNFLEAKINLSPNISIVISSTFFILSLGLLIYFSITIRKYKKLDIRYMLNIPKDIYNDFF